jgi:hypothetical protein
MSKGNKIDGLNKPYYVMDEYGHNDAMLVRKVNELIRVVNQQQRIIRDFENMIRYSNSKRR